MRILALDTSSNTAAAAVMEDDVIIGEYVLNHKKTHSQKIMVMIERLLDDLELKVSDIDYFAASVGPGSFTGLRIGVETVKALAHAVQKPVISVGTLEALAYNVPATDYIIVSIMDARRGNVYAASYMWDDGLKELGSSEAMTIDECIESCRNFLETVFVGDGVIVYRDYIAEKLGDKAVFLPGNCICASASSVAAAAAVKIKNGKIQSYLDMKPYYIKKSQAERELEEREAKEMGK